MDAPIPVMLPWNEKKVRGIAGKVAFRKRGLFSSIAGQYQHEDLVEEAMLAAKEAWPTYNPWKSALSTFVYNCAENHLIDLQDKAEKKRVKDQAASAIIQTERGGVLPHDLPDRGFDLSVPLGDWLAGLCLAARLLYAAPADQMRRSYARWQMVGFGALMARLKLSPRCARFTLLHRSDLRRILVISKERVPSKDTLWRAHQEFLKQGHPDATPTESGIEPSDETLNESRSGRPVATEY